MIGLSLSGGGARGAYQAGVVKGIADVLSEGGFDNKDPFSWYSGISAGSINTTFCAANQESFPDTAQRLCDLWSNITPSQVYRSDAISLGRIGFQWLRDASVGALFKRKMASQLLDARPLLKLLDSNISFDHIQQKIDRGVLKGVSCTAFSYCNQKSVTFQQVPAGVKDWERPRRYARNVKMNMHHVLASCSIPILFSPVQIDGEYFGDGTVRNTAPLSPIIHMGCGRFIFVGVRYPGEARPQKSDHTPSIAKVFGTVLNGLFFDSLDIDIHRLNQINSILDNAGQVDAGAKRVHTIFVKPSRNLAEIAMGASGTGLPRLVEYLLSGLGDKKDSAELASYLLFDGSFTKQLVELGYEDARNQKKELLEFFESSH